MTPMKRVLLRIAIGAAVLLCVAPFAWNAWTEHALDAAKARCRAAGLPMTVAEIRPAPILDTDNAALLFEKIGTLMKTEAFAGTEAKPGVMGQLGDFRQNHPGQILDDAAINELTGLVERSDVKDILLLAREAAARRGCDAHLDYSKGVEMLFPNVGPQLDSLKLLAARARVAAGRHETEAACADLWAMFRLAEFPAREPTLIAQLTRIAGEAITSQALERTAAAGGLSPEWAEKFGTHLRSLELTSDFVRSLDGERVAFGSSVFEKFIAGDLDSIQSTGDLAGPSHKKLVPGWRYTFRPLWRLDYAFYLDRTRIARSEIANTAQGELAQHTHLQINAGDIPRYYMLTAITLPTLQAAARKLWQAQAAIEVTIAGLALERYRARHSRYPETLAALVPEFLKETPRDLFTDKPLIYRHWEGGAVIYSIGANRFDDGGVLDGDKDDLPWHAGTEAIK